MIMFFKYYNTTTHDDIVKKSKTHSDVVENSHTTKHTLM